MQKVAFVGEESQHGSEWTGRWHARWADQERREHGRGPTGVSLADALAWARAQADVVLVRPGDSDTYHSAGAAPALDHPPWSDELDLGRRPTRAEVPAGGAPVLWHLRHGFRAPVEDLAALADTYAAAIDSEWTVQQPGPDGRAETVSGVIAVTAPTRREAVRTAHDLLAEARRQVGRRLEGVGWSAFVSAETHSAVAEASA